MNLTIDVANGTKDEESVRSLLNELLGEYDCSPWYFTPDVVIDETTRYPHSHPVLTIGTRFSPRTRLGVLSTFLHEQIHWHLVANDDATTAAIDDLRVLYPEPPAEHDARDELSVYLHLVVNWLELRCLAVLIGDQTARGVIEEKVFYRWMYDRVLRDEEAIGAIVRRHGLSLG